jgi:hypothetical protein
MAACTSAAAASASWRERKTRSPEKNIGKDGANPYQWGKYMKIGEIWIFEWEIRLCRLWLVRELSQKPPFRWFADFQWLGCKNHLKINDFP